MMLKDKLERLANLIQDKLNFETETSDDYLGHDVESRPQYIVMLDDLLLKKENIHPEEVEKIFNKMHDVGALVWFYRVKNGWELVIEKRIANDFIIYSSGLHFVFDPKTGFGKYADKISKFPLRSLQYEFLKLLASDRNKTFSYEEITKALYPRSEVSDPIKLNIRTLVRDIKNKIFKDVGEKLDIFESNEGYKLKR